MNKFESVIILKNDETQEEIVDIIKNIENIINEKGKLEKFDNLGKKRLAYEVKGNKEGFYIVFYFEGDMFLVNVLEKFYRSNDDIIKFITIKSEN